MDQLEYILREMRQDGEIFPCRNCGKDVAWKVSKAGKKYLAQPAQWIGEFAERIYWPGHRCTPDAEYQARRAIEDAMKIAKHQGDLDAGEVVKGQRVVVARGRKVPKGTEGTLTWIAKETDAYGNLRAGVKQDDGTMIWVNFDYLMSKKNWEIEQAKPVAPRKRAPKVQPLADGEEIEI